MILMHDNLKTRGERPRTTSTPTVAPTPALLAGSHSPSQVQEIPAEEATRRAPKEGTRRVLEPKSVRELCSSCAGVDGQDYQAIRMCNLPEHAPDVPLEIDLTLLMHEMQIWLDGEASASNIRGTQIPREASDLYTLSSKVLMDGATKAIILVEMDEATRSRESIEKELGEALKELADLRRQLADSQEKLAESHRLLNDSESQL
ncbi:hypothetical protein B296_00052180 [Ensete ventricosum]|uniref:Uncharacterized protein n=1 Tax=Ensete ventricosum TaxID=4639 RepID=A0A426YDC2_ENSVE|nr:hypothetical protein B296_00052180 [Ensete ventricosum]